MAYKIIDNTTGKTVEEEGTPRKACRSLFILGAHELKNNRIPSYRIEPSVVLEPWQDLDLPSWAVTELEKLDEQVKLSESIVDEVIAEEVFAKKYAREGETLEDAQKRIANGS